MDVESSVREDLELVELSRTAPTEQPAPAQTRESDLTKKHVGALEDALLLSDFGSTNGVCTKANMKRSLLKRVGRVNVLVLIGGSVLLAGCFAFLLFLWFANSDDEVWRRIVLANWMTRSITLTGVLIRLVVTTQAALCTSMLAALALRKSSILIPDAVGVCVMQFKNTGPASLVPPLYHSVRKGRGAVTAFFVLFVLMTTTVLQFTSTVLLSDVTIGIVSSTKKQQDIGYDFFRNNSFAFAVETVQLQPGYWATAPAGYPKFAEYIEAYPMVNGVHDTGTVMRAFIPIYPQLQRELLKSYTGMATVYDTRVVCMRPMVSDLNMTMTQGPREAAHCPYHHRADRYKLNSTKVSRR